MTINVATAARKAERAQTADEAYTFIDRFARSYGDIHVTINVSAPHDEAEATKFLTALAANARFSNSMTVTGRRIVGDIYEVYVSVSA